MNGTRIDLAQLFDEFIPDGTGQSSIKEVYDIIPNFSQEQIHIISTLLYLCEKWELNDLREFVQRYMDMQSTNKNLGFFDKQSAKAMLKAHTADDLIRGFKPSISHVEEH